MKDLLEFVQYVLNEEGKTTYPHPEFVKKARSLLKKYKVNR